MIQKSIQEIAQMLNASLIPTEEKNQEIQGVCIDSRDVQHHSLYIPLIGARVDGHSFIEQVKEKGAQASLWQKDHLPYPEGISLILVDDTLSALQDLAKAYISTLDCKVVAVTGSNGKTSCKDMLYSVLSQSFKTQKTQGNHNNEIGLPLTILEFDQDIEVGILEMGMENFDEISFLCSIAQPDIGIITTIGSAHMENLGSKRGIAQAKCELVDYIRKDGLFLYNDDTQEIRSVLKDKDLSSFTSKSFGTNGEIHLTSDVNYTRSGIQFSSSILEHVELNALGDFQAYNALPVIYTAQYLGMETSDILYGLKHIELTKMRSNLTPVKQAMILDDTYKSNPESAKAAFDTLMKIPSAKHYAILSDMLDLGPDENRLHEEIGKYALENGVDGVYCVGELSKYTVKGAKDIATWYPSKQALIADVADFVEQDCIILVKGSRAMKMDEIVASLQEE